MLSGVCKPCVKRFRSLTGILAVLPNPPSTFPATAHHADFRGARGFCLIAHDAVSAQLILALASEDTVVFILDTDLHAANGTRAIIGQLVKDHPELQGRVVVVDLFV